MVKWIQVTEGSYDWIMKRGGEKGTASQVVGDMVRLIERYEADRERLRKWVEDSEGSKIVVDAEKKKMGGI